MGTLLCTCLKCAVSCSYDDSSWRQTAFSQSVALMSPLCPSVHSEGWLSLVCVGHHSTIRPSLPVTYLSIVCVCECVNGHVLPCLYRRGQYITSETSAVGLLCLHSCASYRRAPCSLLWEWAEAIYRTTSWKWIIWEWKTVCPQTRGGQFLHVASNQSLF